MSLTVMRLFASLNFSHPGKSEDFHIFFGNGSRALTTWLLGRRPGPDEGGAKNENSSSALAARIQSEGCVQCNQALFLARRACLQPMAQESLDCSRELFVLAAKQLDLHFGHQVPWNPECCLHVGRVGV